MTRAARNRWRSLALATTLALAATSVAATAAAPDACAAPRLWTHARRLIHRVLHRRRPVSPTQWIARTRFINASPTQIEARILARIARAKRAGKQPVLLLDIDSTLFPTEPRSGAIYHEWARSADSAAFLEARRLLAQLPFDKVPWGHRESLIAAGLPAGHHELDAATKSLTEFWSKRFFTNEAVAKHDRAYAGAAGFVQRLHAAGARVIYLTGRDKQTMRDGTLASLANNKLPHPDTHAGVELLMRESGGDAQFKGETAKRFSRGNQEVVAFIDNEPSNLSAVRRVLPRALEVFFHSTHSEEPATPLSGIYTMKAFPER